MDTDYFLHIFCYIHVFPFSGETVLFLLLALLSLIVSAYLSASELAYFSLDSSELNILKHSDHPIDKKVVQLLEQSEQLLASLLIANAFACISYIVFGYYCCSLAFDIQYGPILNFVILLAILLPPLLLFEEMIPKIYASQYPLKVVRNWVSTVSRINKFFTPLSCILVYFLEFIKKKFPPKEQHLLLDDLSQAIEMTENEDISNEKELFKGIVAFGEKTAVEIMTARLDIADIDIKHNFKEIIDFVLETGYSRIPVYAESDDNIQGVLYIKDLLPYLDQPASFRWQFLIRPAYFVPETKKINDLLEDFRKNKIHLAIVVDEFGGTSGLVTMEDILEEIVGEIRDEYDDEEKQYIELSENIYILQGKILLNDFFKIPGISEEDFGELCDDSDTLAGLILELKGDFPEVQETIDYKQYHFIILEIEKQRILKVKLILDPLSEKT